MAVTYKNGVIEMTADDDAYTRSEQMRVHKVVWTGAADTNDCVIQDADSQTFFIHKAVDGNALDFTENYDPPYNAGTTITAETLDGGNLYIHLMD